MHTAGAEAATATTAGYTMQYPVCFRFLPLLLAACCATASADVITEEIALLWSNGAGTATPPGHGNVITQTLA